MLFQGFNGVATALVLFATIWLIIYMSGKGQPIVFDPGAGRASSGRGCC